MVQLLFAVLVTLVVAVLLFSLLKKAVKLAFTFALFIVVFLVVGSFLFPEFGVFEKGKDYIVEKGEGLVEQGKDNVVGYVVVEVNESFNDIKDTIQEEFT